MQKNRITVKNDWEALTWYVDDVKVQPPTAFDRVIIKGITWYVEWKWKSVPYDDHGHRYTGDSWHCFILEHGILGTSRISLSKYLNESKSRRAYAVIEEDKE